MVLMADVTPPSFSGVHHVAFTVRNLAASVACYQRVFQGTLADGKLRHYGREWTGYAELVIDPRTGFSIGLHHNEFSTRRSSSGTSTTSSSRLSPSASESPDRGYVRRTS
jgi:hypothetical protein